MYINPLHRMGACCLWAPFQNQNRIFGSSFGYETLAPVSRLEPGISTPHDGEGRRSRQVDGSSQLVLIENVLREARTLPNAAALKDLPVTQATDTGMDATAMIRAAADYMQENRTGRTEIWIASEAACNKWKT